MDLYTHPTAKFRQQCVDQAIKAGASPATVVSDAQDIEAYITQGAKSGAVGTPFRAAERALHGQRWSGEEALRLKELIDVGTRG